ncbi:hypothetical protein M427DRAFT_65452 [Gonapodya prolifera JEL478]|uniref:Uncharacterized protein n=1 Tax=Gonapodya prolifera (strain JEL478) TaxID=1344416 RepID=A0A139B0M4_GONPJ|nr:hypothetical protein M427DRAFT_65452 [Gonapodya prolifera JEL478]|eukprot:KXS22517.1 hypothetical protein M427DRAFT_65452 [Gonapodya prolifera JEL478]
MTSLPLSDQLFNMLNDVKEWNPLPPKRQYLTGLDSIFLAAEKPEVLGQVSGIYVFEKRIDPAVVKRQVEDYCRKTGSRAMQRIVRNEWIFGRPYFEDVGDDFDIDQLFSYVKLPSPGNDNQIMEVAGKAQATDFNWRHPLMHCTYVDGVDNGRTFALVWRAHHAMADGQGFTRALISYIASIDPATGLSTMSNESSARLAAMQHKAGRRKSIVQHVKSRTEQVKDYILSLALLCMGLALYVFNMVWIFIGATGLGGRKSLWHPDPKKRAGMVPKQVGWTSNLSLTSVKRVKTILGCTVNDLLLACVAGGLQSFCESHGQLKDKNFVMLIPTSLRRSTDFAISNESAGYMLTLPVSLSDPIARVRAVASRMDLLKKSLEPTGIYVGGKFAFAFPWLYRKSWLHSNVGKVHGAVTNVPGPAIPLLWSGTPITRLIPVIPCTPNGLGIAIESYADHVAVSCNMDLDESLPKGVFYGPGTAAALCKAIEDELRKYEVVAEQRCGEMVREVMSKVGVKAVKEEVGRVEKEAEGKKAK